MEDKNSRPQMTHRMAVVVVGEWLRMRRGALKAIKIYEQNIRDISKTFHLNIDLSTDTVTEEVVK